MGRLRKLARDTQAHYIPELRADPEATVQGLWFLWRMRPDICDFLIQANDAGIGDAPPLLYRYAHILDLDY